MKLAVIVPTLNEGHGVAEHLKDLQDLRQQGHALVVVDGGSVDETVQGAQDWADAVLQAPRGRASQMNAALNAICAAQADVLLFLHADTRLPPRAAERVLEAVAGGALWGRFDVRIEGSSPWLPIIAAFMNLRSRLTGIATGDQALFIRRSTFLDIGGFAPIKLMEDIEISRRLRKVSAPACLREKVSTSGRRWERHGVWRTIMLMWHLRYLYWRGVAPDELAQRYAPHRQD